MAIPKGALQLSMAIGLQSDHFEDGTGVSAGVQLPNLSI